MASKKRAARHWTNWGVALPPFPALYAYGGASSSGAGSSSGSSRHRRRRTPPSPPALSSGFSSEESEEEDVVDGDYVASDEAEARVLSRIKRRSELTLLREVAADDAELEEALRLIERQKAEKEEVQQRQKAEERVAGIIVIELSARRRS
jgi:hypothetical protein